jgi:hypothetical protein
LDAVDDSYINYENQIALLQRAMKISSDELFVANKKLRRESESLKGVNENLADILNSMNLNVVQLSVENNFNPIEYLKGQALEIVSINTKRRVIAKLSSAK